jgi:hypothetical protein
MKNVLKALCGAALLISFSAKAQIDKKLYANLNFGYSLPLISQPLGSSIVNNSNSNSNGVFTSKYETNFSRLGSGIHGGLVVGYAISNFVAVEVGANYTHTATHKESVFKTSNNNVLRTDNEVDIRSSVVNIMPGLRFFNQFGENEIFFRMAPVFGITSIYLDRVDRDLGTTPRIVEQSFTLNGGLSYGIFISGGYTRYIAKNLGISVELFSNLQNYSPRKLETTRYVVDGNNRLPDLKKSDREFTITNEATFSSEDTPNDNWPTKIAIDKSISYLLSGVGLQIGLHYKF